MGWVFFFLIFLVYSNTKKCKEKIASLEKDLASLEGKVEEIKVNVQMTYRCYSCSHIAPPKGVLTGLEEEARGIVAKQQGIHVG